MDRQALQAAGRVAKEQMMDKTVTLKINPSDHKLIVTLLKREARKLSTICMLDGLPSGSASSRTLSKINSILDKIGKP